MYTPILLIPAMLITVYCHTPKNDSDVIVTYSGHAEALNPAPILQPSTVYPATTPKEVKTEYIQTEQYNSYTKRTTPFYDEDTDSGVFIPNERPILRNRDTDFLQHDESRMSIKDILTKGQSISDVLNDKRIVIETESPKADILFISGKNNENEEPIPTKRKETEKKQYQTRRDGTASVQAKTTLTNCKQLDCNNTVKSVCGGKVEHKLWRYRLFLNECYFNKVNCNFKYEENRFQLVPLDKCSNTAGHYQPKVSVYRPAQMRSRAPKSKKVTEYRRSLASRRSFNKELDGRFCSHLCPSSCPEQYEPECAVSNKGERRVFMNHCKLDYNSCYYGTVWQKRPLAECVGGKKADLTRNSAFIGWMQRVGIVDNKGRLKLE